MLKLNEINIKNFTGKKKKVTDNFSPLTETGAYVASGLQMSNDMYQSKLVPVSIRAMTAQRPD